MPVHPTPLTPDTAPASPGSPVRAAAEANLLKMQQAATAREAERQQAIAEANAAVNAPPSPPRLDAEHTFDDAPALPTITDIDQVEGAQVESGSAVLADPPEIEEEARPDLAGKRVVLYFDTVNAGEGWSLIEKGRSTITRPDPLLYEGTRDDAIKAMLDDERNGTIADMVREDPTRLLFNSVPASSWAPAPVKPKVTQTTWVVVR